MRLLKNAATSKLIVFDQIVGHILRKGTDKIINQIDWSVYFWRTAVMK